jgi:hypothetical protein
LLFKAILHKRLRPEAVFKLNTFTSLSRIKTFWKFQKLRPMLIVLCSAILTKVGDFLENQCCNNLVSRQYVCCPIQCCPTKCCPPECCYKSDRMSPVPNVTRPNVTRPNVTRLNVAFPVTTCPNPGGITPFSHHLMPAAGCRDQSYKVGTLI